MAEHTPTPYAVFCENGIWSTQVKLPGQMWRIVGTFATEADATFHATACNSHEALLAALQMAHAGLCEASVFIPETCMGAVASCDRAIAAVNTALQSARGDA